MCYSSQTHTLTHSHTHHLCSAPNQLLSIRVFRGAQPISFRRDTALVCKSVIECVCCENVNKQERALALCYSDNGIVLRP